VWGVFFSVIRVCRSVCARKRERERGQDVGLCARGKERERERERERGQDVGPKENSNDTHIALTPLPC